MEDARFQVFRRLSSQHIQHNSVGDQLHLVGVLLQSGRQRGFSLGDATQVELGDSLSDDGQRGRRARRRGQFLVDVKGRLVFLAALVTRTMLAQVQYTSR